MAIILTDLTSNANTLTNNGASEFTSSLPFTSNNGGCVDLEAGSNQYLSAGDTSSLSLTGTVTLECWVRFESTPSNGVLMPILTKWENATDQDYAMWLFNDGGTLKIQAQISQNGNGTYDGARWNWTPTVDTWYHLALTITPANASATTFELFIDASSQGNGTMFSSDNASSIHNGNSAFYIGRDSVNGGYFDGQIDDVRVWDDIRTGSEITNNRSIRLIGNESNLVAYWTFDSGNTGGSAIFNLI
jgi:Concanavalin A-like lectin/glucanases superfamily